MSQPAATEANAVATVVQALALGRVHVRFPLRLHGRRVLALAAASDPGERVFDALR